MSQPGIKQNPVPQPKSAREVWLEKLSAQAQGDTAALNDLKIDTSKYLSKVRSALEILNPTLKDV